MPTFYLTEICFRDTVFAQLNKRITYPAKLRGDFAFIGKPEGQRENLIKLSIGIEAGQENPTCIYNSVGFFASRVRRVRPRLRRIDGNGKEISCSCI